MRNGYDNFSCVPHIEKYQADLGNTYSHERTEIVVSPEFTLVRVPDCPVQFQRRTAFKH